MIRLIGASWIVAGVVPEYLILPWCTIETRNYLCTIETGNRRRTHQI